MRLKWSRVTVFGRVNPEGGVAVFNADGLPVTRIDASVYPVGSPLSARYEHPAGITLSGDDARRLGLAVE